MSPDRRPDRTRAHAATEVWVPGFAVEPGHEARLTVMQANVLGSLCEGKSNKGIARDWGLSEDTVKSHVRDLLAKLGASDRAHAIALVYSGAVRVWVPAA